MPGGGGGEKVGEITHWKIFRFRNEIPILTADTNVDLKVRFL